MSDKIDETKQIKRRIDDETVEQLVENRFVNENDEQVYRKKKQSANPRKKKRNIGLNILITALAFVLVFVIFFLSSYIFFTAEPPVEEDVNSTQESKPAGDKDKDKDKKKTESGKHFDAELDEEAQEIIDEDTQEKIIESSKPAASTKSQVSESSTNVEKTAKPVQPAKSESTVKKPAAAQKNNNLSKDTNTIKEEKDKSPVSVEKADKTDAKQDLQTEKEEKNNTAGSTVVEKNENSEAIVFE